MSREWPHLAALEKAKQISRDAIGLADLFAADVCAFNTVSDPSGNQSSRKDLSQFQNSKLAGEPLPHLVVLVSQKGERKIIFIAETL